MFGDHKKHMFWDHEKHMFWDHEKHMFGDHEKHMFGDHEKWPICLFTDQLKIRTLDVQSSRSVHLLFTTRPIYFTLFDHSVNYY